MRRFLFLILTLSIAHAGFGQSDRGSITGTVTDPQNLAVPGADVQAINLNTHATYPTVTTTTGNYTLAQLPAGVYELDVALPGFKKFEQKGITVQVAQTLRIDIKLEVGAPNETVTVTADATLLKTDSGEVSHNITTDKIDLLPVMQSTTIRSSYTFATLMPGAYFGGSGNLSVNGQRNQQQVRIEGQEAGNMLQPNNFQMTQPSVDAVQEVSLQASNYSAEFGQAGGGVFNFTFKSGTNQIHGTVYDQLMNTSLNSGIPFTDNGNGDHTRDPVHRNDYGTTVGGPVYIPKLYNGKNRTFFFFSYEAFRENIGNTRSLLTIPTEAMRKGDFSSVLGKQIGTDPLGRPIYLNQIYDPLTERTVNGQVVRDPFQGNIIPANRISSVAQKIQAYIPLPIRSGNAGNWDYSWVSPRRVAIFTYKIDQNLGAKGKLSFYHQFGTVSASRQTGSAGNEGLPDPITAGNDNNQTPRVYRLSYDYTVSARLLLHLGAGYQSLNFKSDDVRDYTDPITGKTGPLAEFDSRTLLGLTGAAGLEFPRFTGLSTTYGGMPNMGNAANATLIGQKPTAVASITYVRGNHTFKAGGDWRIEASTNRTIRGAAGIYNFSAAETGLPYLNATSISGNALGFPYASFLLGLVDSANVTAPADPQYRKSATAIFIQDSWKVTRKLTLDVGLRWDYQTAAHELYHRMSEFAPNVANPSAGGLLGAVMYDGYGPGRCNCSFFNNYPFAVAPRLGIAYQAFPKTVLRAGWGIFYAATPAYNGVDGAGFMGVGWNTLNFTSSAFGTPAVKLDTGMVYNQGSLYNASLDPGIRPSSPGQTDSPNFWMNPNAGRPPRMYQWSIGLQREITTNLMVEATYVGSRGVWLQANSSLTDLNGNTAARLKSFGLDITNSADQALLISRMNSAAVINRGFKVPYAGFPVTATLVQALRPFPQFGTIPVVWSPTASSWYDSLQAKVSKRMSKGLDMTAAFTWQKELQLGESGMTDAYNRAVNKAISANSQPLVLTVAGNYEFPALGKNRWIRAMLGQWTFSALVRYASGTPIAAPSSNNQLNNLLLRQASPVTYANRIAGQPLFLKDLNCHCFDPNMNLVLNPAAWSDPAPGTFGTGAPYYGDYRNQRRPEESMSFGRMFRFRENLKLQIRAQFQNVFNRTEVANPTGTNFALTPTIVSGQYRGGFGYLNTGSLQTAPRSGLIVMRFYF